MKRYRIYFLYGISAFHIYTAYSMYINHSAIISITCGLLLFRHINYNKCCIVRRARRCCHKYSGICGISFDRGNISMRYQPLVRDLLIEPSGNPPISAVSHSDFSPIRTIVVRSPGIRTSSIRTRVGEPT
jgi:hypothetical protein